MNYRTPAAPPFSPRSSFHVVQSVMSAWRFRAKKSPVKAPKRERIGLVLLTDPTKFELERKIYQTNDKTLCDKGKGRGAHGSGLS